MFICNAFCYTTHHKEVANIYLEFNAKQIWAKIKHVFTTNLVEKWGEERFSLVSILFLTFQSHKLDDMIGGSNASLDVLFFIPLYNIELLTGCNRITILGKRKENDNWINVQNNVDLENHVNCV